MVKFFFIFFGLLLIIFFSFYSCTVSPNAKDPPRTLARKAIVNKSADGYYSIHFSKAGKWKIYHGPSPEKIDWTKFSQIDGEVFQLPDRYQDQRLFFGLAGAHGDSIILSERLIPLKGQPNFRDLGGLETNDGRYVKWGMIYRSGKLSNLKKNDLQYMSHLGIRSVVDLRNDVEIAKDPDRIPEGATYYQIPVGDKEGKAYNKLRRMVMKEGYRKAKAKTLFVDVMRSFADSLAEDIRPIFDLLLSEEESTPMVYHCTGGKDRTGYTTAMILLALGVDRKTITDDYLMSNYYRKEANLKNMRKIRLTGLDAETIDYAILVRKEYMEAVFGVIDEKYGGTDAYLELKFGLTKEKREEFKRRYSDSNLNNDEKPIEPIDNTADHKKDGLSD